MGHKDDKPDVTYVVQHLKGLWIGMGNVLTNGNWPAVSVKIKHLGTIIQKYFQRTSSQAERQMNLINLVEPARNVENASNVTLVESLRFQATLHEHMRPLNSRLIVVEIYLRVDVNPFMDSLNEWQRCDPNLFYISFIYLIDYNRLRCFG
jgi:hypothetical protein